MLGMFRQLMHDAVKEMMYIFLKFIIKQFAFLVVFICIENPAHRILGNKTIF